MLKRVFQSKAASIFYLQRKCILSQAYRCDELWGDRLTHDAMKSISARDLGVSILQKISSQKQVSGFDFDTFANKIHELDVISMDFVEKVIESYCTTQSAIQVIDSAPHAVVRSYIQFGEANRLLGLLQRRASTGLFLDPVSANLLADHFAEKKEWSSVVDVVWELCLQHYFYSNELSAFSVAYGLLAVGNIIQSGVQEEKHESTAATATTTDEDEDDEVDYKFVDYVRNPNYDGFFDVDRLRLKCGFILLHLHSAMCKATPGFLLTDNLAKTLLERKPMLAQPIRIFGLALSEQADLLTQELQQITTVDKLNAAGLTTNVLTKLLEVTETMKARPSDSPLVKPGEPLQPTELQVEMAVQQVKNLVILTSDEREDLPDFLSSLHHFAYNAILTDTACMELETERVRQLYTQFASDRDSTWNRALRTAHDQATVGQVKDTLRQLLHEEEKRTSLLSPANSAEVTRQAWLAPRTRAETRWSRLKEWRQDIIEHRKASAAGHERET